MIKNKILDKIFGTTDGTTSIQVDSITTDSVVNLPPNYTLNTTALMEAPRLTAEEQERMEELRAEYHAKCAAARLQKIMQLPNQMKMEIIGYLEDLKAQHLVEEMRNLKLEKDAELCELEQKEQHSFTFLDPKHISLHSAISPVYLRASAYCQSVQLLMANVDNTGWPSKEEIFKTLTQWALENELSEE